MKQKLAKRLKKQSRQKGKKRNKNAFVLIELLCSLGIITITLSLIITLIPRFTDGLVALQARLITAEAKGVQQRALASGREAEISLQDIPRLPGIAYTFPPGASGPPGRPTTPLTNAITFTGKKLHSSPSGVLTAGTVYVGAPLRGTYRALTSTPGAFGGLAHYRWNGRRFIPT